MAKITFGVLTCVKKDDTFFKDEIEIRLNGNFISGPHKIGKGDDPITIGGTHDFSVRSVIRLFEVQGDTEKLLGTAEALAAPARREDLIGVFHDQPGTDYHLTYVLDSTFPEETD